MAGFWFHFEFIRVLENAENRRRNRIQNKILRDNSNPFLIPDTKFRKLFRLPKALVQNLIQELEPLAEPSIRSTALPIHLKVLVTLNFVAHGGYQTTVGEDLNIAISQSAVSKSIREITAFIGNHLLQRFVVFPVEENHISQVKRRFEDKFNFPNVIGAIDCTHVAIVAPIDSEENPTITYYNRKGFYSINVQAICDSDLNILAINARYPGATHDSAIWGMSNIHQHLRRKFEEGGRNVWLLGDAGYNLEPWLITPLNDVLENSPEGRFNSRHCTTRNTIERCFGVLKQRFRCLLKHRTLHYNHATAANIIYTCAVLHNMCMQNNIIIEDDRNQEEEVNEDLENNVVELNFQINNTGRNWYAEGQRVRRRLINKFEMDL